MDTRPFETAESEAHPTVTQLSVFLAERVGELSRLTRALDPADIHILALSVVNSHDCAIVRMIVDDPDQAAAVLHDAGFAISETELLVVALPPGKRALLQTWLAMMKGEVSIAYTYPLLVQPSGRPALAVQADNLELAAENLRRSHLTVLDQSDLHPGP
jgi:hypothetical protein